MTALRTAAQQALDWLYENDILHPTKVSEDLRAALEQQDERDWSLLEATQESLREHMAEIHRLRAALAQQAEPQPVLQGPVRIKPGSYTLGATFVGGGGGSGGVGTQPQQAEPVKHKHQWFSTGAMEPGEMRCIQCGAWAKEKNT